MANEKPSWRVAVATPVGGGGRMMVVEQWEYPEGSPPYPSQQIYIPPEDIEGFHDRVEACVGLIEIFKQKKKKENRSTLDQAARAEKAEVRVGKLEAEVERLRDEVNRRLAHYEMVGRLLDPIREKRHTGEPARSDREELTALIDKEAELERLREYVRSDAYCPCCGDHGPTHSPDCVHRDERMELAREVLYGRCGGELGATEKSG